MLSRHFCRTFTKASIYTGICKCSSTAMRERSINCFNLSPFLPIIMPFCDCFSIIISALINHLPIFRSLNSTIFTSVEYGISSLYSIKIFSRIISETKNLSGCVLNNSAS